MAVPPPTTPETELAEQAVAAIHQAGCEYGDIRVGTYRQLLLAARDRSLHQLSDRRSSGLGVRVLYGGAWGFAASYRQTAEAVAQTVALAVEVAKGSRLTQRAPVRLAPVAAYRDTYTTPITTDPFQVPVADKAELLLSLTERLLAYRDHGIQKAYAFLDLGCEAKTFASTEGSLIQQTIYRTYPGLGATALADGDAQSRSYDRPPLNAGYEHVAPEDLLGQTERVAQEAIEKVRAPEAPASATTDLVLKPSNLFLTIHESVGHPTELDRVYGDEANFAGTSFATPQDLGALQYAAPWLTFRADRTQAGGRSTVAYDDEGVPTHDWPVIQNSVLVDYLTDRETAHRLGRAYSHGTAFADS
jgi:TldD protein